MTMQENTSSTTSAAVGSDSSTRTTVLDLTTMAHALNELMTSYLGEGTTWTATNPMQERFLTWFLENRHEIAKLSGLEALAARDADILNSFLEARGFRPQFEDLTDVGVASVIDMLVQWKVQSTLAEIVDWADWQNPKRYPAFTLPGSGADVFTVAGYNNPLACLATRTGHKLWLMKTDAPDTGLDLAIMAQQVLAADRRYNVDLSAGVTVPMLDFDRDADISWMLQFSSIDERGGGHAITQAFQQFKLRLDNTGARVKVATGFGSRSLAPAGPEPYVFDSPFLGFFTQPGHDTIALAAFYADVDVWKKPEGSLEEL
jgi:hypothetical protein